MVMPPGRGCEAACGYGEWVPKLLTREAYAQMVMVVDLFVTESTFDAILCVRTQEGIRPSVDWYDAGWRAKSIERVRV